MALYLEMWVPDLLGTLIIIVRLNDNREKLIHQPFEAENQGEDNVQFSADVE